MCFYETSRLHEHAAAAAARVVYAAGERLEHFDEKIHHAARRVELAAILTLLCPSKHAKEVFVDAAENVVSPMIAVRTETDGADEVNELAEHLVLEVLATVIARQDTHQRGVLTFDESHCLVNGLTDPWQLGLGLQLLPAGAIRNPEDVLTRVFVPIFQE